MIFCGGVIFSVISVLCDLREGAPPRVDVLWRDLGDLSWWCGLGGVILVV